jgi:RNA-binding protein YlmH
MCLNKSHLLQVRTVPVEVEVIPRSQLRVPTPKREELRSVEASLRLDAIASAGGLLTAAFPS